MDNNFFDRFWWKNLLVAILSTTISIILTFGTAWLLDLNKQRKERRLTALMVLSSIESFSRGLDTVSETWDWQDSIATWLLSIPVEEIEELGNEPFEDAIYEIVRGLPLLKHDKTAENIFSNNIDTWKNMENFHFIDNVGKCFSEIEYIEQENNDYVDKIRNGWIRISDNPSAFPGKNSVAKYLREPSNRQDLLIPQSIKVWTSYCAEYIRIKNRNNMKLIGISEKEVMDFTDESSLDLETTDIDYSSFEKPDVPIDSIAAHLEYAIRLDSLRRSLGK